MFACADVSFRKFSFRDNVYIAFYHPKLNFSSVKMTAVKGTLMQI